MLWIVLACAEPEPTPAVADRPCERFEGVQADWYVDPLGPADGDGTAARPFPTLEQALGPDRTVALAPGNHGSLQSYDDLDGLVVMGSCDTGAVLSGPLAVYLYQAGRVEFRDLTLRGGLEGALTAWNTHVVLRDVRVRGTGPGVLLQAESFGDLERVTVEGTDGIGVFADYSTLRARQLVIDGALETGLYVKDSPWFKMEDSVVQGTRALDGQPYTGVGVDLYLVDSAAVLRTVVHQNHFMGVHSQLSQVMARDLVVTETLQTPGTEAAYGLFAQDEGLVRLEHSRFQDNHGPGVFAIDLARIDVVQGDISDNHYGVDSVDGGRVFLYGARVVDNRDFGIVSRYAQVRSYQGTVVSGSPIGAYGLDGSLWFEDTTLDAADTGVAVREGYFQAERVEVRAGARGVELGEESSGRLSDVTVAGADEYGVVVDASHVLADGPLLIQDTDGIGLQLQNGGSVHGPVTITNTALAGAAVLDARLSGSLVVDGVRQQDRFGFGLYATDHALVTADVDVAGVHGAGVLFSGEAVGTGPLTVRDVGMGTATATGFGVAVQDGAVVEGPVAVQDVAGPGLSVVAGGHITGAVDLQRTAFAGLVIEGGTVDAEVSIQDVAPDAHAGGGVGVFVDDGPHGASTVTLAGSVHSAPLAGVYSKDARLSVSGTVSGGPGVQVGAQHVHGDAVVALGGQVDLVDATLHDASRGVFLHGATATLDHVEFSRVETSLVQQGCPAAPVDGVPDDAVICPEFDDLVLSLSFDSYVSEAGLEP